MQLAEMDHAVEITPSASESRTLNGTNASDIPASQSGRKSSDSLSTMIGTGGIPNEEDDSQRAIAKAALSIAELSESVRL